VDWYGNGTLIATCGGGAESVLRQELEELGVHPGKVTNGSVAFRGNQREVVLANLALRTASRVLVPVVTGSVRSYDDVYRLSRGYPWESVVPGDQTFVVQVVGRSGEVTNPKFAAVRLKDGIVDRQRTASGRRSSVDRTHPHFPVVLYLEDGRAQVSLDSSGPPLHQRGYRTEAGEAPLRETLAAAVIALADWKPPTPFLDPMCGSGTFCIEAALIAARTVPGLLRSDYAFRRWPALNQRIYAEVRETLEKKVRSGEAPIFAADSDPRAVEMARRNAGRAGIAHAIEFRTADFSELAAPTVPGTLVMNPPYGERLRLSSAEDFYRGIGRTMKDRFAGWDAWILSANRQAMKQVGLRAMSRTHLYDGSLETTLSHIPLFPPRRGGSDTKGESPAKGTGERGDG